MDVFQFMDSVVKVNDHGDCAEDDAFDEHSLSPGSSDVYDVFGEPQILPRVDEEYQVEIPPQCGSVSLWLTNKPAVAENTVGSVHDFLVGLAVPIVWIADKVENIHPEPQEAVGDSPGVANKDESLRSECIEETPFAPLENGVNLGELAEVDMEQEGKIKMHDLDGGKGYCLVPGSLGESWNDIEERSFILGLYIFGKNFVQVKKFVGNKEMGDILSFYYGRFYRSDRYHRWSECRKMRSRKCIYGQRIFTGLRQQEFFSRLLSHVSEECQNTLMEASKSFGDGKMVLEEYVFALKALVGLSVLVEAVGIGKEKQDLTGIMEPLKSTQVAPVRPEIPIGKACSTLTPLEIVNFITGDFRLSKARSSDLFWEAVWPRLLARGWHSEQPNGSKHSLVFLIPGITKFSKRKLVKGNHYFDSVSDVLSKVASDPVLLELEIEERGKEENGWTDETKVDQEDFPDQQRHYYLKPRTPNHSTDLLKFTVVDTSLTNGKTIKVRELRSLPSGVLNTSTLGSDSEEDDVDHSEETMDKSQSADTSGFDMDEPRATDNSFDQEIASNSLEELENNVSNEVFRVVGFNCTNVPVNIPNDLKTSIQSDAQPKKAIKCQLNRRMGVENKNCLLFVTKQHQKLNACSQTETNSRQLNTLQDPTLKQEIPCSSAQNPDFCENPLSQIDICQEKKTSTSLSEGSITIGCEGILSGTCNSAEHLHDVPQSGMLIDLNLPIPPDAEADDLLMTKTKKEHDKTSMELDDPSVVKLSNCVANSEQQPNIKYRRQSMRSRPPTIKALEALAFGFLDPKQKRKSRDVSQHENPMLRPSQRARVQVRANENIGTSVVDLKVEERANGVCHSNGDLMTKLQV